MSSDANLDSNDFIPALQKSPSTKPTNLDQQMGEGVKKNPIESTPPLLNHEDTTPEEAIGVCKESLKEVDTSASDIGMSFLNGPGHIQAAKNQPMPSNGDIDKNVIKGDATSGEIPKATVVDSTNKPIQDTSNTVSTSQPKPKVHDWIDVLGNGNLLKKVLREGEGVSTRPTALAQVRMKVRGSLSSGGVVDRHSSLEFTVGDGDVIQALDIIAPLMEKGETCQIKTDHRYAFGAVGRSPDIPPNSSLMYDLELIDIKRPVDYSVITEQEILTHLNRKRGRGNDLFQRKEFSLAVHSYSRAVNMMARYKEEQSIPKFSPEISDLWVRCLNNLAAAQLKVEMYNEALESVTRVLETDPENVKALYRCGKVYMVKGEFENAVTFLQRASKLNPEERAIQAELQRAIRKRDQGREQEKAMYKRMMTGTTRSGHTSRHASPSPGSVTTPTTNSSWNWRNVLLGAGVVAVTAVTISYLGFKYRGK